MLVIILLQFLSAVAFILFKKTLIFGPPFFLVGLRMVIGALPLLACYLLRYYKRTHLDLIKKAWIYLLAASFFNIYVTNAYALWSMQYVTAAFTSFIYNLSPFLAAGVGYFFFHERMTRFKWLGMVIGVMGFIPVLLWGNSGDAGISIDARHLMLAKIGLIVSACSTVFGWSLMKKIVVEKGVPNTLANGLTVFAGGCMSLVHATFIEQWPSLPLEGWAYVAAAAVVSPALCYWLYIFALTEFTTTFVLFSGLLATFFTAILGYFFLGESISWAMAASSVCVFVGLYIFYTQEKKGSQNH